MPGKAKLLNGVNSETGFLEPGDWQLFRHVPVVPLSDCTKPSEQLEMFSNDFIYTFILVFC